MTIALSVHVLMIAASGYAAWVVASEMFGFNARVTLAEAILLFLLVGLIALSLYGFARACDRKDRADQVGATVTSLAWSAVTALSFALFVIYRTL